MSWQGRHWDGERLDAVTVQAQNVLEQAGLRPGARVAIYMDNCPLFVVLVRACSRAGYTVVPLPPSVPEEALHERVRSVGVDLVVATQEDNKRATSLAQGLPLLHATPEPEDWRTDVASGIDDVPTASRTRVEGDGLVAVLFSSGSTGQPRAWGYPEKALQAHAESAGKRLAFDEGSVALGVLPLHHAGGFMLLDRADRLDAHLVLAPRFEAQQSFRLMIDHGVTHTSWVPLMLQRVMELGEGPPSSLRCVLLGGDATSSDLLQQALAARWPVYPSYGLTETCSQAATATPDEARREPATVGRPLQGVEVEVQDAHGSPCSARQEGRIVVRGVTLARDLSRPTQPKKVVTDDHGWLDEQGHLFVTGRDAHRIVTGGHTVSAREVEAVLESDENVAGAVVVGLEDSRWGQVVAALVEPAPGVACDEERLQALVRDRLGRHARPRRVVDTDRLPRTVLGKKDRPSALRQVLAARMQTP